MFGSKEKDPVAPPIRESRPTTPPASRNTHSDSITAFLGPDVEIEGTLRFEHSVLIEGRFHGTIESKGQLVVGESANVEAEITAGSVTIKGRVKGSVNANERVQLLGQGVFQGDLTTPSLQMDESVTFEGSCSMPHPDKKQGHTPPRPEVKPKVEEEILDAVESVRS